MSEPTTKAGQRAAARGWRWLPVDEARWNEEDILAVEAEARALEHDRLAHVAWAQPSMERDAEIERITHEIEFLTVHGPSDDDKPGWYWDGWHAALAALHATLGESEAEVREDYDSMRDKLARLGVEYQRFYDFVADSDPALVDAWHFGENNKPGGLAEQVRAALADTPEPTP